MRMVSKRIVLSCIIFTTVVLHVTAKRRLDEGDACILKSRQKGICREYRDCPFSQYEYEKLHIPRLLCRQKPKDNRTRVPIVCCDETSKIPTTSVQLPTSTWEPTTERKIQISPTQTNLPKSIAEKKCIEYSKWIAPHKTFFEDIQEYTAGECGVDSESFILGGVEAKPLEFPHMARLGFGEESDPIEKLTWECGGSLISEQFVLTAAHCLRNKGGVPVHSVRLGNGDPQSTKVVKVMEKIPYPRFNPPARYNDIALLKLEKSLKFNDYLRPACLHTKASLPGVKGVASGWGRTEKGALSTNLLKVNLPFFNHANCTNVYDSDSNFYARGILDDIMICAGELNVPRDTCQGDSGGPLQVPIRNPECMYSIVGVTSFGMRCGVAPGIYTRVSPYISWIEKHVWSKQL